MTRPRRTRLVAAVSAVLAATGLTVTLSGAPAGAEPASTWSLTKQVCATPTDPAAYRCYAERSVDVASGTPGATRTHVDGDGPAGGYTPTQVALAYGIKPSTPTTQTVAVVDWYDDPYALADLNVFNKQYHLPAETGTSFRKVNQKGTTTPLPKASRDMAGEITLDIETVRGLCHHCKILLVEANNPSNNDLAAAEDTAARLGATEISNSWGGAEGGENTTLINSFKHPGVVITASTGDDGWYGWDYMNYGLDDQESDGDSAASYPATSPYVVAVGGTTLTLNPSGSRAAETVWNANGDADSIGKTRDPDYDNTRHPRGASGGGCSGRYGAPTWQQQTPGYTAANCHLRRSGVDIAALADPKYGYDVYDRYGGPLYVPGCTTTATPSKYCWATAGGTSLSSPVIATMYALAGGSGGSAYPAASLYVNTRRSSAVRYDVTTGGNGFCDDASIVSCANAADSLSGYMSNNPNSLVLGRLHDCSFKRDGTSIDTSNPPPASAQCNATTGFDGPTGLGTPRGLSMFTDTSPNVDLAVPPRVPHRTAKTYIATLRVTTGAHITAVSWSWGDGTATSGTSTASRSVHTYRAAGTYHVTFSARDSFGQTIYRDRTVVAT